MGRKEKRPDWFKVNLNLTRKIIDMDPLDVGEATKAAAELFANGVKSDDVLSKNVEAFKLYALYESNINAAFSEYNEAVENGRKGQEIKNQNSTSAGKPP